LEYLFTVKNGNPKNREFQDVYLLKLDLLVNEYVLDAEEVTEVKYIYYEELEKMVKNGVEELTMHDEEYARLFEVLYERLRN
jgi:isopentenyldiphosphate isomerase